MNILFYRYGSICEPDIIDAFKQLGNTVDEITIEIYNKNFTPSDGVSLLSDTLFMILCSVSIFIPLFQRFVIFLK